MDKSFLVLFFKKGLLALACLNAFGQPIGPALPDWRPAAAPPNTPMIGRYCRLERIDPAAHSAGLFAANADAADDRAWTYLYEPPRDQAAYTSWLQSVAGLPDPFFHAVIDAADDRPCGVAAYLRIDVGNGVIEVGHINFSPRLQRTRAGTEAMFLMMRRAFEELGYRRTEWKCDALNAPSRRAALRYGFTFEGIFRQAVVTKGRNRDTAWYSIIDTEWPAIRARFMAWLAPENFVDGVQVRALGELG